MIYINGIKASQKDIDRLAKDLKNGTAKLTQIKTTKKGATAIKVN